MPYPVRGDTTSNPAARVAHHHWRAACIASAPVAQMVLMAIAIDIGM